MSDLVSPTTMTPDQMDATAEALKTEFRTLRLQWFIEDAANNGPCDMTPWNLLAIAAAKAMGMKAP